MPKKIVCRCHGPIALSKKYSSPWEDVWLSLTDKPGRKEYYLAPCLIGKKALESDINIVVSLAKEYKEDIYKNELKDLIDIYALINYSDIYVDKWNDPLTSIYTSKDYINREEAERMIAELMRHYGYENIICKWKRPKIVVIPT